MWLRGSFVWLGCVLGPRVCWWKGGGTLLVVLAGLFVAWWSSIAPGGVGIS